MDIIGAQMQMLMDTVIVIYANIAIKQGCLQVMEKITLMKDFQLHREYLKFITIFKLN